MIAIGAYLETLRKHHGWTRADVAVRLCTHESQIERVENGKHDTRSSLLFALVHLVGGDLEQVSKLVLDKNATEKDGQREALTLLDRLKELDDKITLPVMKKNMAAQLEKEFAAIMPGATKEEVQQAVQAAAQKVLDGEDPLMRFVVHSILKIRRSARSVPGFRRRRMP